MPHPESGGIDQTRGRSAHSWQPCRLWKGALKEKQAFITISTGLASLHPAVWRLESAYGPPWHCPPPCSQGSPLLSRVGGGGGVLLPARAPAVTAKPLGLQPRSRQGSPARDGESLRCSTVTGTSNTGVCARPHSHEPTPPREMDFLKQTAFPYASRQSHVSIRDPQTETWVNLGQRLLNQSCLGEIPLSGETGTSKADCSDSPRQRVPEDALPSHAYPERPELWHHYPRSVPCHPILPGTLPACPTCLLTPSATCTPVPPRASEGPTALGAGCPHPLQDFLTSQGLESWRLKRKIHHVDTQISEKWSKAGNKCRQLTWKMWPLRTQSGNHLTTGRMSDSRARKTWVIVSSFPSCDYGALVRGRGDSSIFAGWLARGKSGTKKGKKAPSQRSLGRHPGSLCDLIQTGGLIMHISVRCGQGVPAEGPVWGIPSPNWVWEGGAAPGPDSTSLGYGAGFTMRLKTRALGGMWAPERHWPRGKWTSGSGG